MCRVLYSYLYWCAGQQVRGADPGEYPPAGGEGHAPAQALQRHASGTVDI